MEGFVREQAIMVWHASGSVFMGREEEGACVDSAGKVFGVQGLRVADMSVCPILIK